MIIVTTADIHYWYKFMIFRINSIIKIKTKQNTIIRNRIAFTNILKLVKQQKKEKKNGKQKTGNSDQLHS